ncbi:hypothetical protein TNCV_740371 [Trichonephila clavipes]|nr:hypothetical protein TNCV_740371 [Trichonephila clavipes]
MRRRTSPNRGGCGKSCSRRVFHKFQQRIIPPPHNLTHTATPSFKLDFYRVLCLETRVQSDGGCHNKTLGPIRERIHLFSPNSIAAVKPDVDIYVTKACACINTRIGIAIIKLWKSTLRFLDLRKKAMLSSST